jgi:hypothetical protein
MHLLSRVSRQRAHVPHRKKADGKSSMMIDDAIVGHRNQGTGLGGHWRNDSVGQAAPRPVTTKPQPPLPKVNRPGSDGGSGLRHIDTTRRAALTANLGRIAKVPVQLINAPHLVYLPLITKN